MVSVSFGGLQPQKVAAADRSAEEACKVARLFVEMDRREDQFDGPFGGQTLGLQRIGKAEAADGQIGACGADAVQLPVNVLPFGHRRASRDQVKIWANKTFVNVGLPNLHGLHPAFAHEKARERDL